LLKKNKFYIFSKFLFRSQSQSSRRRHQRRSETSEEEDLDEVSSEEEEDEDFFTGVTKFELWYYFHRRPREIGLIWLLGRVCTKTTNYALIIQVSRDLRFQLSHSCNNVLDQGPQKGILRASPF
jgi:hypothetical protein